MLTYTINEFLSLRLENGRTNIYVNGERFNQCMYLLLNIPVSKVEQYNEINSIDEAAETLSHRWHGNSYNQISAETEFVAHCSNIQAWAENDYNTCILHRNIAFPLLRKLSEVGDIKAKRVYKDEIASRFSSGHITVMLYLLNQGYLKSLNKEEINTLMEDLDMGSFKDQKIDLVFQILQQIEKLGYSSSKALIRNQIKYRFDKGIAKDIYLLVRRRRFYYYRRFFNYFSSEELSELFNNIDITQTINQRIQDCFPLLRYLTQMGNTQAPKIIKDKIMESVKEKRINDIIYIIKKRFLKGLDQSQIEEILDKSTINLILEPSNRESFSCLKHLPVFITSSEESFNFLKVTLSGGYFVYKTQAAVLLINHFFERGYKIIDRIITNYKKKIRLPVIEALMNKNCEQADNLLKFIDWSRIWYANRRFLKIDDKFINFERAHKILLENHFKVIQNKSYYTIYEFSSYSAFEDLIDKIDKLNQNTIVEFNILERSLIRDAKLILPALPLFDLDFGIYKKIVISIYHTTYWKEIYFINDRDIRYQRRHYYYYNRTGNTKNLADVLQKMKALCDEIKQDNPNIMQEFYSEFNEFKTRLEKYYHDCNILKTAINHYLSSTSELLLIKNLNIEYEEKNLEDFRKVYPSTFKPSYDKNTNTLTLYEAHQWGKYHADSNIKIHESGVVFIFVNTFVNYSKKHNYHNAQVYFFFPCLKRFYTRKANVVRNIKDINNWDISITNLFGYEFLKDKTEYKKIDSEIRPQIPTLAT
ncbi:MAG: hypothetical protein ACFFCV_11650 [Promethearchaeota archaeon]